MRLVVVGKRIGSDEALSEIASIREGTGNELIIVASDPDIRRDLMALVEQQFAGGGFFCQVGNALGDEVNEQHITYAVRKTPE